MQYLVYLHKIVAVIIIVMLYPTFCGHKFKLAFGALKRSLILESLLRTVAFITSGIGDKVFKHTKFSNGTAIFISKPLRK